MALWLSTAGRRSSSARAFTVPLIALAFSQYTLVSMVGSKSVLRLNSCALAYRSTVACTHPRAHAPAGHHAVRLKSLTLPAWMSSYAATALRTASTVSACV